MVRCHLTSSPGEVNGPEGLSETGRTVWYLQDIRDTRKQSPGWLHRILEDILDLRISVVSVLCLRSSMCLSAGSKRMFKTPRKKV